MFPLSNWTELDIWQYIYLENISIPELYFAKKRAVVEYMGTKIMVDDDRMPKELRDTSKEEVVAIILIDARQGVLTQTKRHSYITSLLGIKNIIEPSEQSRFCGSVQRVQLF